MIHKLIIVTIGFVWTLIGCAITRQPEMYENYQSVVIGETLSSKIQCPKKANVTRSKYSWEATLKQERREPFLRMFCLGGPICNETALVVTDFDGTVIAKQYHRFQHEDFWFLLRMRTRWRSEWEVISPASIPLLKSKRPDALQKTWHPSKVARVLQGSAHKWELVPNGIDSVFQLMDIRTKTHSTNDTAFAREDKIPASQIFLTDFIHDVELLSRLSERENWLEYVQVLLNRFSMQGQFDGDGRELWYEHPTRINDWGFQSGTTTSHIRVTDKNTVLLSIDHVLHTPWLQWFLTGCWFGV